MLNVILVYCPFVQGHKLEYIHHLYEGAQKYEDKEFIFVVSESFKTVSKILEWPQSRNIKFEYISDTNKIYWEKGLALSFYLNKNLKSYVRKYNANKVFLIDLLPYFPFVLFQHARVSGIVYKIYPYGWKQLKWYQRIIEFSRIFFLAKSKIIESVYVLNDELGAYYFNRMFNSRKFCYICDPISTNGALDNNFNLCSKYKISNERIIYLHAGGMLKYKGTLQILKAIQMMDAQCRKKCCFIFAGRVTDEIRKEFEQLYNSINDDALLKRIDGYLSFEQMNALFSQSDYVLIPYYPRLQSSGIISYAALFNKPVITTKKGVVGKLVGRYKLGILMKDNNASTILATLNNIRERGTINGSDYIHSHTISGFINVFFKNIYN